MSTQSNLGNSKKTTLEKYLRDLDQRGYKVLPAKVSIQDVLALYDEIHELEDGADKLRFITAKWMEDMTKKRDNHINHENWLEAADIDAYIRGLQQVNILINQTFDKIKNKSLNDMTPEEQNVWFAAAEEIDPNA